MNVKMGLLNADRAWGDRRKLTDYLLSENSSHWQVQGKIFREVGFNRSDLERLEEQLSVSQNETLRTYAVGEEAIR